MGFQGLKGLLVLFFASTEAVGAAGAWTLLIKVLMNSWKRLLFGRATRARVSAGPRAGASGLGARSLMAGFLRWTKAIVTRERSGARTKRRAKIKREEFSRLSNGLTEPLDESF